MHLLLVGEKTELVISAFGCGLVVLIFVTKIASESPTFPQTRRVDLFSTIRMTMVAVVPASLPLFVACLMNAPSIFREKINSNEKKSKRKWSIFQIENYMVKC